MLTISDEAISHMKELLAQEENTGSAIRIAVMGDSGLGLVVDDPQENDVTFDRYQVPILVEQNLMNFCKTIEISFKTGESDNCGSSGYIIETEGKL